MSAAQYTFEEGIINRGAAAPNAKNRSSWAVCQHLTPILESLIAHGSKIDAVDEGWSAVDFVVYLNRGPHPKALEEMCDLPEGMSVYQNKDAHYPLTNDLDCKVCRQGISWPQ